MGTNILGPLGTADGKGVVRVQDRVDASIETVWSAITDPALLATWWGELRATYSWAGSIANGCLRADGKARGRVCMCCW